LTENSLLLPKNRKNNEYISLTLWVQW